ncbi:MAG: bifunctional oligoribonuclease/PAP phosphatase NrnA [Finegoldia sp.]|nr:bifunctional oligoribonuclease/PAP phosphatase NrnA [Finegoldia sp.]
MIKEDDLSLFKSLIKDNEKFALISHRDPDGDNLGSLNAFSKALTNLGKDVKVICFDKIPYNLKFLSFGDNFTDQSKLDVDILICLDCANYDRLGDVDYVFSRAKKTVNIDHHMTNENYADINMVKEGYSSTCELVYDIFESLEIKIDEDMATSILTGISTDTGRFLYGATTAETLRKASDLVKFGAKIQEINLNVYQSKKFDAQLLQNEILSDTRIIDDHVALSRVSLSQLEKYKVDVSDIDNVINIFRDTDKIDISILIKEKATNDYKVSFRSKGEINVSEIAEKLGGGGHFNAAATRIEDTYDNVVKRILDLL